MTIFYPKVMFFTFFPTSKLIVNFVETVNVTDFPSSIITNLTWQIQVSSLEEISLVSYLLRKNYA